MSPRPPPFSIESEQSALGSLMLDPRCAWEVFATLREEDFYRADHRVIFRVLKLQHDERKPMDYVSVGERMKNLRLVEDAGGMPYLASLQNDLPSAANAVHYAKVVREKALLRNLIAIGGDITQLGYDPDDRSSGQLLARAQELLGQVQTGVLASSRRYRDVALAAIERVELERKEREAGRSKRVRWGLRGLDQLTGGFSGGRLIIVAARPKCAKSALAVQGSMFAAKQGQPVFMAQVELEAEEVAIRGMSHAAQVNLTKLDRGCAEEVDGASQSLVSLGDLPFWIDDKTRHVDEVCAQIALHKHRYGVMSAVVDWAGLMTPGDRRQSKNDQAGEITWKLKTCAKSLGIPIIALWQLARLCDKENRRPRPDDLRDSGNVEQDLDALIMLHTPMDRRKDMVRELDIGVPLNRMGPPTWGDAQYEFNGRFQTISQIEEQPEEHPDDPGPEPDPKQPRKKGIAKHLK